MDTNTPDNFISQMTKNIPEMVPMDLILNEVKRMFRDMKTPLTENQFQEIKNCASMLDNYVHFFPKEKGCPTFAGNDMRLWKEKYYPDLVLKGPKLPDHKFYTNSDAPSHIGIGTDGGFSGEELFQFLYRVYKAITFYKLYPFGENNIQDILSNSELLNCADMLEAYIHHFPETKGRIKLSESDMELWKVRFYPGLVTGGPRLPDDTFFKGFDTSSNPGIGTDGEFSAYNLFQFLYRLYKEIAGNL